MGLPILKPGEGFVWTPVGLKAEELATYSDLSPQMQNIVAKYNFKQQQKEKEEQEKIKKIQETAKKIEELGLSEADSPRDFYAVGATSEQMQRWDQGEKLARGVGLGMLSLPYVASAIPEIYSTLKYGVTTPVGRQLAAKAALSTLGGEAMYQATESGKSALNNSRFGNTNFNIKLAQPLLSAIAVGVDPDSILENNLKKGITNAIARDMASTNPMYARIESGKHSKKFKELTPDSYVSFHKRLIDTFGPEVLAEAFPFLPEYMHGLDPSITPQMAKDAFLSEIISGEAFVANGQSIVPSGAEIVRRGLAKKAGYGNDGLLWMRGSSKEYLANPHRITYSAMATPGVVDKYVLTGDGTEIYDKAGKEAIGFFNKRDAQTYAALLADREDKYKKAIDIFNKAIASKDKTRAISALQEIINYESRIPSKMQRWNLGLGKKDFMPAVLKEGVDNYDIRAELGGEYFRRIKKYWWLSDAIRFRIQSWK